MTESYLYSGAVGAPDAIEALVAEYWTGIGGGDPNVLLEDPAYPDSPDGAYLITGELRDDIDGDSYGQRIRGYIVPPMTGAYTFYIASDDGSRLFLSADTTPVDTDPALGNQIAAVADYTGVDEWDKEAGQASAPVSLTAGNYYYIEVLHKEGAGADHVSVGWSLPGTTDIVVIPGTALRYALN
ncbi:MAG: hypothetical protein J7M40_00480 [Planctomycetes bacterium]|nr:hypothetical protein [Planctomycetota bacterium]